MEINYAVLGIGLVFFIVCSVLLFKQLKSKKTNTESVTATVVGYHTEISHDTESGADNIAYFPIMRYCVNGKWYEKKSDVGRGKEKYIVGEHVELLYDPQNPENYIIAGDNLAIIVAVAGMAAGIALCILAF